MLDLGGEGLCLFIDNPGVILAQTLQDEVRDIFNIMLPFFFATNIIDLSRLEIIHDVGKGAAVIFNVVKNTLVSQINSVGLISECFIDEGRYYTTVGAIVFVRSIGINRSYPYCFRAKHSR